MAEYYDRAGNPITLTQWSRLMEDNDYRIIARDRVGDLLISTIWLGLNHNHWGGRPLVYETMVFGDDELETERYQTEAEAILGHQMMVSKITQAMKEP